MLCERLNSSAIKGTGGLDAGGGQHGADGSERQAAAEANARSASNSVKFWRGVLGVIDSMAPEVGLEPTTLRLTAECSAIELLRNICGARENSRASSVITNREGGVKATVVAGVNRGVVRLQGGGGARS